MEGFTIAHDLEDAINTLSKEYVPYSVYRILMYAEANCLHKKGSYAK